MAINKRLISYPTAAGDTPAAAIKPSENFETVLYTGNGGTQSITGGWIGKGGKFNGSSSYVTVDKSVFGTGDGTADVWSFSMWFKTDGTVSENKMLVNTKGNYQTSGFAIYMISGGQIRYYEGDGTNNSQQLTTTNDYDDSNWHHLAVTRNASNQATIYIDGSEVIAATTMTNPHSSHTYNLHIGRYAASGQNYWDGILDQVRIFNKELSSSEVTTLYGENSSPVNPDIVSGCVALYEFEDNVKDTANNGKYGKAAHFNGLQTSSASYIDISSSTTSTTSSVSLWINTTTKDSNQGNIFDAGGGSSANTGFAIIRNPTNGYLKVNFTNGTSGSIQSFTGTTDIADGDWHHIVLSMASNDTFVLYLDGQSHLSGTRTRFTGSETHNKSNSRFGTNVGSVGASSYGGKIDDVRFFDTALSANAVDALYDNDTADSDFPDSPVAHYKLDGNALDETGDYDGTATNVVYGYDGTASNITYSSALSFQPDLVWIKDRDNSFNPHELSDSVRGVTGTLNTNTTNAEYVNASFQITSFDTNGFTVVDDSAGNYAVNGNNIDYVAWAWKAGGSAVSNTDGSITSSVSANQAAGFSVVKYTTPSGGSGTVGHGLSSVPEIYITKRIDSTSDWYFNTTAIDDSLDYLLLNSTAAKTDSSGISAPTSTVFSASNFGTQNEQWITYCFHSVDGYQKVGTYTATGSAGSPTVTTGFQPRFVIVKNIDRAQEWIIVDSERGNGEYSLIPNSSSAENTTGDNEIDFNADGFTIAASGSGVNYQDGDTFIYLAIAADADTTTPVLPKSFDVTTYTGDGGTARSIETRFKPDLVWVKQRNAADNHAIFDSVRGINLSISSNLTNVTNDRNSQTAKGVTSFDDNGFTVGSWDNVNADDDTYVAWTWKAGDHDDNLPETNTEGSIDSTVSVNDAAGFSIVKYTGTGSLATVGHGLSSAPELIIIKNLDDGTRAWLVYDKINGATKNMSLNSTAASAASSAAYNDTEPTAEVFTVNTSTHVNAEDDNHIAYCWYSVSGYSKIGSYSGNGGAKSITGLGFKPDFVLFKCSSTTGAWIILDSTRGSSVYLVADDSAAEASTWFNFTFDSDGWSVNTSNNNVNGSGQTYIYMALKIN